MWLSVLGAGLQTKWSLVWFPVRAHDWVVGQVKSHVGGVREATTHRCFSHSFSLPFPLSKIKQSQTTPPQNNGWMTALGSLKTPNDSSRASLGRWPRCTCKMTMVARTSRRQKLLPVREPSSRTGCDWSRNPSSINDSFFASSPRSLESSPMRFVKIRF